MATTITTNMSLPVPVVGTEPGPQYATDVNNCLTIVDGHNHSIGSGVQITPSGLNINIDLTFQNNNLLNVKAVNLNLLTTTLASSEQGYVYASGVDLYFNDGNGSAIQITKAGVVNATIGSIPGESYSGGTFTWVQGTTSTTPANFDLGSMIVRPNTAGTSAGISIQAPVSATTLTNFVLPLPPASGNKFMQMDNSGNVTAAVGVDNATILLTSNTLYVPTGGITSTQIANQTVTQGKLALRSYGSTVGVGGIATTAAAPSTATMYDSAYANVPGMSVTITTTGRPVMLMVTTGSGGVVAKLYCSNSVGNGFAYCRFSRSDGETLGAWDIPFVSQYDFPYRSIPATLPSIIDYASPPAGTYTYTFQVYNATTAGSQYVQASYLQLIAYEL